MPTSLKTEVITTAVMGEWMHFLDLRMAPAAHPQMREVACKLKDILSEDKRYKKLLLMGLF